MAGHEFCLGPCRREIRQAFAQRFGAIPAQLAVGRGCVFAEGPIGFAFDEYMQTAYRQQEKLT